MTEQKIDLRTKKGRALKMQMEAEGEIAPADPLFSELGEEGAAEVTVGPPEGYSPMADAPTDGRAVYLTDGEQEVAASFRRSRQYNAPTMSWTPISYWAIHNAGGRRIAFDPTGWRSHG